MFPGEEYTRQEYHIARFLFLSVALFLISGYASWGELIYLARGEEIQATVSDAYVVNTLRKKELKIEYYFREPNGVLHHGIDTLPVGYEVPIDGVKVMVRYVPGKEGRTRLLGHVNWNGLFLFGLGSAAIVVFALFLWIKAVRIARHKAALLADPPVSPY